MKSVRNLSSVSLTWYLKFVDKTDKLISKWIWLKCVLFKFFNFVILNANNFISQNKQFRIKNAIWNEFLIKINDTLISSISQKSTFSHIPHSHQKQKKFYSRNQSHLAKNQREKSKKKRKKIRKRINFHQLK